MIPTRRGFLAGGLAVAGGAAAEPQANPPRVGVVNVRSCFEKDKYARMAEGFEELGKLRDFLAKEASDLQKKIVALNGEMENASPKGDIYADKLRLRGHAEYDLKLLQEVARRKLRDRINDLELRVYADVRRVVAGLARAQNLDLVLRVDEGRVQEEDAEGAAVQRITSREVLYHADALDLTPLVLAKLNADWAKAWTCATCKRKAADEKCPDCGTKRP